MLSSVWGPFSDVLDAANNLCRFVDMVLNPGVGVALITDGKLYPMRRPAYDKDGVGELVTFQLNPAPPPVRPPAGSGRSVVGWFNSVMEMIGRQEIEQGQAQAAVGQAIDDKLASVWRNNFGLTAHQSDGVGVAIDAVGVGLSLVLASLGPLEVLGLIALVGGAVVLVLDGAAYTTEMAGHEEIAKTVRYYTFYPRCLATLATLPDALWNIGKVVLDAGELSADAARSLSTAGRASDDAARVTRSAKIQSDAASKARDLQYAKRYSEIGAAALQRAQAAQRRLAVFVTAQSTTRGLISPGIVLLTKEAVDDPENRPKIQAILSRYVFHVSAVHRP